MNDNKHNIKIFIQDELIGRAKSITVDMETDKSPHLLPDYSQLEVKVLADFFKGLKPGELKLIAAKTGTGQSRYNPLNLKYSVDNKSDIVYDKDIVKQRRKT